MCLRCIGANHLCITVRKMYNTTQNNKIDMPEMYRCKHLSITAWAYAKLQKRQRISA